jgi:hypothetical protein
MLTGGKIDVVALAQQANTQLCNGRGEVELIKASRGVPSTVQGRDFLGEGPGSEAWLVVVQSGGWFA